MGLTEKQTKAAEALATRTSDESIKDVCERAGISQPTLWRYRQDDEFRKLVDQCIEERTWSDRGPVLAAIARKAKEGDVQAARLFLQHRGELTEKHEVQQTLREVKVSERAAGPAPK